MAATYRSATQNGAYVTGTGGLTIDKPTGVANGDTLIAFISAGDDAGGAYTCSGWSQASGTGTGAQATTTGNDIGSTILRKYITNAAGEPSSYTFTNTDTASQNRVGFIVCVQETDATDPIDELTQTSGTNDWTPSHIAITTGSAGCCVLFFHVGNIGTSAAKTAGAPSTPSGTTLIGSIASSRTTGNYASAEAAYYHASSAGSITVGAWTGTPDEATSEWHVYSVAVRSKITHSITAAVGGTSSLTVVGQTQGGTTHNVTAAIAGTSSVTAIGIRILNPTCAVEGTSSVVVVGTRAFGFIVSIVGTSQLTSKYQPAFVMSLSNYIVGGGENTTAQLTPPVGKTTGDFEAGRISDDENPLDAIDLTTDNYTEAEWSIKPTVVAGEDTWEFRVTVAGVPLDYYSATPTLEVFKGATHSITTAINGTSSLTSVGVRVFACTGAINGTSSLVPVGSRTFGFVATFNGTSSVTVVGIRLLEFVASILGTSSLVVVGINIFRVVVSVTGTSSLTAVGQITGLIEFTATILGTSSLVPSGVVQIPVTTSIQGSSELTVLGARQFGFDTSIQGTTSLNVNGSLTIPIEVIILALSSLTAVGFIPSLIKVIHFHTGSRTLSLTAKTRSIDLNSSSRDLELIVDDRPLNFNTKSRTTLMEVSRE